MIRLDFSKDNIDKTELCRQKLIWNTQRIKLVHSDCSYTKFLKKKCLPKLKSLKIKIKQFLKKKKLIFILLKKKISIFFIYNSFFLKKKNCNFTYIYFLLPHTDFFKFKFFLFYNTFILNFFFKSLIKKKKYIFFYKHFFFFKKRLKKKKKKNLKNVYLSKSKIKFKKRLELKLNLNNLKKTKKKKTKSIFLWLFLNLIFLEKSKTKYRFWNFFFLKSFKYYKYKLRIWPRRKRGVKWFFFFKNLLFLNMLKKYLTNHIYKKDFLKLNYESINKKKINLLKNFVENKKIKKFNWIFFLKSKKFKQVRKLKKIIKLFFFNFFFKINFIHLNLNINLRVTFSLKKLKFFKHTFISLLRNSRFKKWNFLPKQYFLSFLFLFWYKSMYFLSFFLWNNLRKNQKKEKKILYTCLNFLHALPIRYIGIVGFKILIKGKLFKKPRKKTFKLFKGKLSLPNPIFVVQFTKYFIVTRAGTFSFNFWITSYM